MIRIVDYHPCYGDAFERLNREWLERDFYVEPVDETILSDPESTLIQHGGAILFALVGSEAVGTVALKHHGEGVYELTKMAVTAVCQGSGVGRALMQAALQRFEVLQGRKLYLESHSSLKPALSLYESAGFFHKTAPGTSEYERSDVYMEYSSESQRPPD